MDRRTKTTLLFVIAALVVAGLVAALMWASRDRKEREAAMPDPTPTPLPMVEVQGKGGQIFLVDEDVIRILHDRYGINVTTEYQGSFQMVAADNDYTDVDFIWPGSADAYAEFNVNHPGLEMDHETVFKTLLMAFLRKQYLQEALDVGIVTKQGSAYVIDFEEATCAMLDESTWADLGASGIPGYINFRGSAPESSGGGRSTLMLLAAYITEGDLPREVRITDLDRQVDCENLQRSFTMRQAIKQIWLVSGQQSDSSPENWTDFAMIPWPWAISSESLFIGAYNAATEEIQEKFLDHFVGVYPTYTMSTDHVLIALSSDGLRLLEAFRVDEELQRIGWEKYGMRIGIQGMGQTPGGIDITWFLENPVVMPDPKEDVSAEVKELFK